MGVLVGVAVGVGVAQEIVADFAFLLVWLFLSLIAIQYVPLVPIVVADTAFGFTICIQKLAFKASFSVVNIPLLLSYCPEPPTQDVVSILPLLVQSLEILKSNGAMVAVGVGVAVGVLVNVGVGVGVIVGVGVGSGKVLTTFKVAVLPVTVTDMLPAFCTNGETPVPVKVKKNPLPQIAV